MSNGRALVDASNLRSGGGLQVGISFVDELACLVGDEKVVSRFAWLRDRLDLQISPEISAQCSPEVAQLLRPRVVSSSWRSQIWPIRRPASYAVSFVLFGPEYGRRKADHRIVGFADGLSLQRPWTDLIGSGFGVRSRFLVRRRIARSAFLHADELVVEAPHVAELLGNSWGVDEERVRVVPNTVHSVFREPKRVPIPLALPARPGGALPLAFFPTRSYVHKNLDILGAVGDTLDGRDMPINFMLTLDEDEWNALGETTRRHSLNLGPLKVAQLPAAYSASDVVFFPSLLESFSATPLEAMACGVPLVASDRDYVRGVARDAALYADPTDPEALAEAIVEALTDSPERQWRLDQGRLISQAWPSARERALRYVEIMDQSMPS